jgi:hypothetical protein
MRKLEVDEVLQRHKVAERRRDHWRGLLEDAYKYALPQRNLYSGDWEANVPGSPKMDDVYDSTAIHSVQRFANRIQSTLFPPYRNWARLTTGNEVDEEVREPLQAGLDKYGETMFNVLRQSNFDLAMSEFLLDLAAGTACMMITAKPEQGLNFEAVPSYLVALEAGAHGKVDTVYRKLRLKGEAILQQWPDAQIDADLAREIEDKPTEEINLVEATIYRPEENYYCYHLIEPEKKRELVYRETASSAWVITRYMVASGEVTGRGPLLTALPDIRSINATKKLILQNASLAVAGIYTAADDGVLNPATVSIKPGSIIPVARNGGPQGESLRALPRGGDFNVGQMVLEDLKIGIKQILLDDTLPSDNMSARSATEMSHRIGTLATQMGASFGRLIEEALIPIVSRVLYVMDEQNLIELPLKIDGQEVKIVPISPLAKAQNAEELQSVVQFMQIAAGMGPQGQLTLNQDRALDFIADRLGIPARVLNTDEEKEAVMQQMQELAAQAAQAEAPPLEQ